MRLHRSPTSSLSTGSVATIAQPSHSGTTTGSAVSPIASSSTSTLSRDSSYASMRGTPASTKKAHTRTESNSVLSAHGAHFHVRHGTNSSIDAVPTQQQEYAQANGKDATYKAHGVDNGVVDAARAQAQNAARPSSYATQAYREFLASNGNSASTSAASSAAPSRQVSRGPSGYTSQATSGQSSRATSPVSKRDEDGHEQARTVVPNGHNHARTSSGSHYVDALAYPLNHTTTTTTTTVQQVSTLSFGNLMLAKSDSQDSLDDGRSQLQPKYRPNHFTFSSDDIMKSFLRAADRDRARAEREAERQREAQHRLELEQEYERRKLAQREMAYAAQVQATHGYRPDTVGAELTSSDDDEADAMPTRRRRRFPPIPAHFKFSTHDVSKSASKPSQRQNIGHWTTFPRSSTVVIAASQLRSWIQSMIEVQAAERAAARQLAASTSRKQLSAPNSPVGGTAARKNDLGTSTSRVHRTSVTSRRASVPHAIVAGHVTSDMTPTRVRPTHSRSATLTSYEKDKLTEKFSAGGFTEKTSARNGTTHESAIDKSILLRRSGIGGGASGMAQHTRQGSSSGTDQPRYEQAPGGISARRSSLPVKALPGASQVASVAAGALDASARRAAVLQARQQSLTAGAVLNSHAVASAPGSTNHSPTRSMQNGRLVKSTHVSPTRHQRIMNGMIKSSLPPVQSATYSPMPPTQRKASIGGGGESKSASASNSPQMPAHSLLASGLNESGWAHQAGQYEKTLLDVYQQVAHGQAYLQPPPPQPHHTKSTASLASLYRDVPSSGYGQTARGTRLI